MSHIASPVFSLPPQAAVVAAGAMPLPEPDPDPRPPAAPLGGPHVAAGAPQDPPGSG